MRIGALKRVRSAAESRAERLSDSSTRTPAGLRMVGGTSRCRKPARIGFAAAIASSVAVIAAFSVVAPSKPVAAQESEEACVEGDSIRVLFLLDTSRSLDVNDPTNRRTTGTLDALDDLASIANDYRSRLRRYYPQWSVFAAVDTFSGFHSEPELNNPYSRHSGGWKDLAFVNNLAELRNAARGVPQAPGYWTDYREAIRGVIDRFAEPAPGGAESCDHLFWFTDGEHDTVSEGILTSEERQQIDDMCLANGLVDQLRQADVNVTAIELRVDREASEQLRRLVVGDKTDCSGLGGKVADVASVSNLATRMEEIVFRLVDPDFPAAFVGPCDSRGEQCDYRFTLADDVEWVKVYVDLGGVDDPNGVDIILHGPDGQPVAPFRFGDQWGLIGNTGLLGRRPTPNIQVLWAHQVSHQEYGTEWGEDQIWTLRFSGQDAAQARAGTRKDERGRPAIPDLEVSGGALRGTISPSPTADEEATVVLSLDDGRPISVAPASRQVGAGGRFTIPSIVDRVTSTTQGDDYLSVNSCVAGVIVSLERVIDYGRFSGAWRAPLMDSIAEVRVPRALCGLAGSKTPSPALVEYVSGDALDPSTTLRVAADGGLLDGVLAVREVHVEAPDGSGRGVVLGAWDQGWRCEVAADARGHRCEAPFAVNLSADSDTELDLRLVFSSATTDPLQSPPLTDVVSYTVRGVPVAGRLPAGVTVGEDRAGPAGALVVSADGGTVDGLLVLESVVEAVADATEAPLPVRAQGGWQCEVPAGATDHVCAPVRVSTDSAGPNTLADLVVTLEVLTDDPGQPIASERSEHIVRGVALPSILPRVTGVTRNGSTGVLFVTADGGTVDGLLILESVVEVVANATEAPLPVRTQAGWQCLLPAGATGHVCPTIRVFTDSVEGDTVADLVVALEARTDDPSGPALSERSEHVVRGVALPPRLPRVIRVEVGEQFDPSGSLRIAVRGGGEDGIVSLDLGSEAAFEVARVDGPTPQLRPESDWSCEVPAGGEIHECPPLRVRAEVDGDTVVDVLVPFRVSSADPESSPMEVRSSVVEALPIRTRGAGEILRNLVPYLVVLVAVFALVRTLAAWMRRRWPPLSTKGGGNTYWVATARLDGDAVKADRAPRSQVSTHLTQSKGSTRLGGGGVRLSVRWWPLLLGRDVEIVACATRGSRVIGSSRRRRATSEPARGGRRSLRRAGVIGSSLRKGWVALEDKESARYTLVYWDTPKEAYQQRAEQLWRAVEGAIVAETMEEGSAGSRSTEGNDPRRSSDRGREDKESWRRRVSRRLRWGTDEAASGSL